MEYRWTAAVGAQPAIAKVHTNGDIIRNGRAGHNISNPRAGRATVPVLARSDARYRASSAAEIPRTQLWEAVKLPGFSQMTYML